MATPSGSYEIASLSQPISELPHRNLIPSVRVMPAGEAATLAPLRETVSAEEATCLLRNRIAELLTGRQQMSVAQICLRLIEPETQVISCLHHSEGKIFQRLRDDGVIGKTLWSLI